jgi:hypothetical protein
MLAATRDAGREPEPSERDAAAAAAWAALAAENDRLRRENAQLRRPKVPRALKQLAPYNTPGPRSAATPTTSALVAPRRRKLLAAHPSVVSSDDESAPNVAALPEVGECGADPGLLYEQVSEAEVLASKDDAEQNRGESFPRRKKLTSRFTGVWQPDREDKGKWRAAISVRGSRIPLGEFDDEEDAARVYDAAVVKYRGEPTVNFPGEVPRAEVLVALPPPPPPVLGERPPDHVLLRPNEQGDELPSEDKDEAPTRLGSKPRDPPRKRKSPPVVAPRKRSKKSQPPCHAGLTTSLAIALADERWNALEKWTFAHAANPYPSAEDKAELASKAGLPPGSVHHWFSNMRKRKYLKLRDGTLAPRDAFEAQLYQFMPVVQATDADEEDPARALASDPAAFRALYQMQRAPAAHPEATIAPAPSPAEPAPAPAAAAPSLVAAPARLALARLTKALLARGHDKASTESRLEAWRGRADRGSRETSVTYYFAAPDQSQMTLGLKNALEAFEARNGAPTTPKMSIEEATKGARSAARPAATLSGDSLAALPPPAEHVAARISVAPAPAPSTAPTDEPAGDAAAPDAAGSAMDEHSDEDEQERKKRLKREADRRSTQLSRQRKKAFDEDHDYSEEEEEEDDDDDDIPVVRRKKKNKAAPSATAFLRKLLDLVNDRNVPEIAWNEDGTGVSLQRGPALDRVLGDRFAAKNEWTSFLTQLSFYHFTRSSREGNTVVYENASFTRTSTPAQIAQIRHKRKRKRDATG